MREVWIDQYRYAGLRMRRAFSIQPLRSMSVGPAISMWPTARSRSGRTSPSPASRETVDCTMRDFDPRTAKGAAILGTLTASVQLDGELESTHFINQYTDDDPHFDHGKGPLHSSIRVRDGVLENGSTMRAQTTGMLVSSGEYHATIDSVFTILVSPSKTGKSEASRRSRAPSSIARKGFESSPIHASAVVVEAHVPDIDLGHALKGTTYSFDLGKSEIPDVRVFTSYMDPKGAFQLLAGKGHGTGAPRARPGHLGRQGGSGARRRTASAFACRRREGTSRRRLFAEARGEGLQKALDFPAARSI